MHGKDARITIAGQRLTGYDMAVDGHTVYSYRTALPEGEFWAAEIHSGEYGDILVYARDRVKAEGFAWVELGTRMVKRTQTIAYQAVYGENQSGKT